ncbi:MAG TPA: DUF5752 family protein, partial [Nitrospirota bacterium]|nr:DUF5752 family protein [Nitrospirota bacterium]
SLAELRDLIASGSGDSIAHHSFHYFLKSRIMEYTNDFSQWAGESLEESALAEHLSNIDPYAFPTVELLRSEILRTIDEYSGKFPEPREALTRDEFYFNEAVTLVFPAGVRAQNLAEFLMAIKYVDPSSLYYHFYDARVRLPGGSDDFSKWFRNDLGKADLAARIASIDPFMHNLEGIRERIAAAVEDEVRRNMESAGMAQ